MAISSNLNQRRRRLMIGSNVALVVIIVWVIIVLVNFMVSKVAPLPADMTSSQQFSISPRTVILLEGLKDNVTLTAMYVVNEMDEQAKQQGQSQKRQVEDLLRRYADISGKVHYQMLDPIKDTSAKTAMLQRLIKQYSGDTAKHKTAVEEFKRLNPKIQELLQKERDGLKKLSQEAPKLSSDRSIVAVFYRFNVDLNNAKTTAQDVNDLVSGEDIPRYSQAVEIIQKQYQAVRDDLQAAGSFLAGAGSKTEGLPEEGKKIFIESPARYKDTIGAIDKQLSQMTNLPKLELEQVYDQVKQKNAKTIIVEAENSPKVKVLSFDDVWAMAPTRPGSDPNKILYDFKGEAAVSSAILALTAREKSAVIFVHAGPPDPIKAGYSQMRMTQAPYSAVKEKLEQANFIVQAWDILARPQPPVVANAKRRIFIVIPPPPQRQQPGMPPVGGYQKPQVDLIGKLIDSGEKFMFLVNFSPAMVAAPYPFTGLLESKYGIKADPGKLVIRGFKVRDQVMPASKIEITRYDNFEITKPIQSLNTALELAVPLLLDPKLPANVKVSPLISITVAMDDFWGEGNLMMLIQARTAEKEPTDLSPPFYLALAAENTKTKARAVVFGDDLFATDAMVNDSQAVLTAQGIGTLLVNPGNIELFTNSAFWLNNNENLIAVGPRGHDVPRIADISDAGQTAWKIFLWVVWPLAALGLGGVVYMFRRK
jgi:hypothetical protein